jgi:hypothetical protein
MPERSCDRLDGRFGLLIGSAEHPRLNGRCGAGCLGVSIEVNGGQDGMDQSSKAPAARTGFSCARDGFNVNRRAGAGAGDLRGGQSRRLCWKRPRPSRRPAPET